MPNFQCPNCGRPLTQPALSSIGIGGVAVWRGCGDCLPGAVVDAMRDSRQPLPSLDHEQPQDAAPTGEARHGAAPAQGQGHGA